MHWDVLVVLLLLVPFLCSNMLVMMPVCTFCAQHTCDAAADGRHGHADRSPAAQRPHQCNRQTGGTHGAGVENSHNGQHEEQNSKQEDDEQECGLSLDQLGHENVGSQQALRNEDEQNKFVAGIIRRGLYKEDWKLVITGAPALALIANAGCISCSTVCARCLQSKIKAIEAYFCFDANYPIACAHCCMLIQWILAPTHVIQVGLWACDVNELLQEMFAHRSQPGCWGGSLAEPENASEGPGGQVLGLLPTRGSAQPESEPCCGGLLHQHHCQQGYGASPVFEDCLQTV